MYGTQLEAFAAALCSTLHCTQGPPGTGKSYIGVVLIHALNIVKKYAKVAGISLGPIVVLSYKNHALDEILMDVLENEGGVYGDWGQLIRCGKPENPRLLDYRRGEWGAIETLSARVTCLRSVQRTMRD